MVKYQTSCKSRSPLRALVVLEGAKCIVTISGQWNWTTAQLEYQTAFKVVSELSWLKLRCNFTGLEPGWQGVFDTPFVASMVLYYKLAKTRQCERTVEFYFDKESQIVKMLQLTRFHSVFEGQLTFNHRDLPVSTPKPTNVVQFQLARPSG